MYVDGKHGLTLLVCLAKKENSQSDLKNYTVRKVNSIVILSMFINTLPKIKSYLIHLA